MHYIGSIAKKSAKSFWDRLEDRINIWYEGLSEKKQAVVSFACMILVLAVFWLFMLLLYGAFEW